MTFTKHESEDRYESQSSRFMIAKDEHIEMWNVYENIHHKRAVDPEWISFWTFFNLHAAMQYCEAKDVAAQMMGIDC